MSGDLKMPPPSFSDEEFSTFIRDRASLVRPETLQGYYRLDRFEKEVLGERIDFSSLQGTFLMLYFQPFSRDKTAYYLQSRANRPILPTEEMFVKNVPYQTGFSLDDRLREKHPAPDNILVVPCIGRAGIHLKLMYDRFYAEHVLRQGFMGLDVKTYPTLRNGNMHADAEYSFVLMDKKGVFALTSFDIADQGPVVKQIQGMKGSREELDNWPWESALFQLVEDWAGKQGYKTIQLVDPKEILYTQLDPKDEHFVPLENISARFGKVAKRRLLYHDGTRYIKELQFSQDP